MRAHGTETQGLPGPRYADREAYTRPILKIESPVYAGAPVETNEQLFGRNTDLTYLGEHLAGMAAYLAEADPTARAERAAALITQLGIE